MYSDVLPISRFGFTEQLPTYHRIAVCYSSCPHVVVAIVDLGIAVDFVYVIALGDIGRPTI